MSYYRFKDRKVRRVLATGNTEGRTFVEWRQVLFCTMEIGRMVERLVGVVVVCVSFILYDGNRSAWLRGSLVWWVVCICCLIGFGFLCWRFCLG